MWPQYRHCFPEQQSVQIKKKKKNKLAMAMSTRYCGGDSAADLCTDEQGSILEEGDMVFCGRHPFVVTEEVCIDHRTSGAVDGIFQAPDSEFETLQEKVKKKQKSERSRSFVGRMLLSLIGSNKTIKRQVALQKPLKESSEAMALCCNNCLDGSYIDVNN